MKRFLALLLSVIFVFSVAGCKKTDETKEYKPISGLDTSKDVTLTIAIPYETNKALNTVSNAFMNKYPNVSVKLQYVEDFEKNTVELLKQNKVDMILQKDQKYTEYTVKDEATGENVPTGKTSDDYFYNFAADTEIDFSDTTPKITDNDRHTRIDENGKEITYIYTYPLGGETRGVFVNTTLLSAYGLSVPKNYNEFINCCEVLKEKGLIPVQGGGDTAAYSLGLAPCANPVVHDKAKLYKMANAEAGISREFASTIEKVYDIATNRYFDYKAVEETGFYTVTNELGQMQSFLGLKINDDTFEVTKPENNYGYVAFMPYISSSETVIQSLIDEYDLDTKFTFICSPLNEENTNRPAYITPYFGLCANKNSENLVWIREFVNFIFQKDNNTTFADEAAIIPNTSDALEYAAKKYGLDKDTDVTLCGQIRFSDSYNGFNPIANALKNTIKCSAQKYMINLNRDENGNIGYETDEEGRKFLYLGNGETKVYEEYVGKEDPKYPGYAFCTLDYFLDGLEAEFAKYGVKENGTE